MAVKPFHLSRSSDVSPVIASPQHHLSREGTEKPGPSFAERLTLKFGQF